MKGVSGLRYPIEIDLDELAGRRGWHPNESELYGYLQGSLDELDHDCVRFHLDECSSCYETLAILSRLELPSKRGNESEHLPLIRWPIAGAYAAAAIVLTICLICWIFIVKPTRSSDPDGNQTRLHDPSNLITPGGQNSLSQEAEDRLLAGNLAMPEVISGFDRSASLAVRGTHPSADTFSIIGPLATIVSNDRPVFRWTELEGVESYTVSVYDGDLQLLAKSEPLKETEWVIPVRLRPEVTYTWIVVARKGGEERLAPAPPSRAEFRIIGRRAYEKLKYELAQANSHGARGVLFAKAGMLDEAEHELATQVKLVPHDQRSKGLLARVRSWRRESKP